jgi:cytoskeletal protein RodZ
VLFESPGVTVADTPQAQARETAAATGETTVVRSAGAAGKRRLAPWAIGASAVILIGVLFGAFYAYQHRNDSTTVPSNAADPVNANSANAQPAPSVNQAAAEPGSGSANDPKKVIIIGHPANEPTKKNEKTAKSGEKAANQGVGPAQRQASEQYPDMRNMPVIPETPETYVPDPTRTDRRGVRRLGGGVTTRNFPDGRQLMTLPDGTRVVTAPDGTKRVFRRGEKMRRKG